MITLISGVWRYALMSHDLRGPGRGVCPPYHGNLEMHVCHMVSGVWMCGNAHMIISFLAPAHFGM
jgi:hypothetical protein